MVERDSIVLHVAAGFQQRRRLGGIVGALINAVRYHRHVVAARMLSKAAKVADPGLGVAQIGNDLHQPAVRGDGLEQAAELRIVGVEARHRIACG